MATTENMHTQGRAWTVVGTFPTFEAATSRAEIERGTRGQQVKVKQIAAGFTVRTRRIEHAPVESRPDYVEEKTTQQDTSKRSKLKAKDRRARDRKNIDTDDTEE